MIQVNNLLNNPGILLRERGGPFQIIEWKQNYSVDPASAQNYYFMSKMGLCQRQLVCALDREAIVLQAGAMQYFAGAIEQTSGIKGIGDFAKKMFAGKVTGESAIKPVYSGDGLLVTEPTFKYLMIEDLANWPEGMIIDDGMFLASTENINLNVVSRSNLSSAISGGQGIFNLCLTGKGYAVFECDCPRDEIVCFELKDDVLRIDGPFAIAWSRSLSFSVERSGKTLVGSAASQEGLVNVFRGTGKVWIRPV